MPTNKSNASKMDRMGAIGIIEEIKKRLKFKIEEVGSFRRGEEILYDLDFIIVYNDKEELERKRRLIKKLLLSVDREGDTLISGIYLYGKHHIRVDFFFVTPEAHPYALLHYTGPKSYNIRLRRYVKMQLGYLLNQYGLFYANNNKKHVPRTKKFKTEKEIIDFIGTTYYSPYSRK